ncbi:MAG: AAA family ATPase [Phycisphaerae bacterium]|nr:AAA family ATPase [Phycisphaerae bacterium]
MSEIVKTYDYTDAEGKLLYQNVRFEPKTFRQRRSNGNGEFIWDLNGVKKTLYRLQELLKSSTQDFVFITEGEKDADNLNSLGLTATTSGSSTSWKPEFAKFFKGRLVCVLPHNDVAGERYAKAVADSLHGVASEVRIVELPGRPANGGDVSDWLDDGGDVPKLLELVDKTESYKPVPDKLIQHQVLSTVKPKQVEYLQPEVIPMDMLTIIVSQEGEGKSCLASNITAHVTTGKCWPNAADVPNPEGSVIIFNHEEDTAAVLVPRLIANGADLNRVIDAGNIVQKGDEMPFDIENDIWELDSLIDKYPETRLVIFDPITSYCCCNENSNSEVRRALKPLLDFAARRSVAVLGLTHLNKKIDIGMINRTIGSRAWSAVPRMVWGIRTEQVEDDEGQKSDTDSKFLLCIKCNLGPKPKGLRFSIGDGGRVVWDEERVHISIDNDCKVRTSRIDEAVIWLKKYLGDKQMTSAAIFEDGGEAKFGRNLLYAAKKNLKIRKSKSSFHGEGIWFWELPK